MSRAKAGLWPPRRLSDRRTDLENLAVTNDPEALIWLAGTVISAFTDVSTDKLKHLGKAYKPRP